MTKQVLAAEIFNDGLEDFVPRLSVDELVDAAGRAGSDCLVPESLRCSSAHQAVFDCSLEYRKHVSGFAGDRSAEEQDGPLDYIFLQPRAAERGSGTNQKERKMIFKNQIALCVAGITG